MTSPAYRSGGRDARPHRHQPRHRLPERAVRRRLLRCVQAVISLVAVGMIAVTGYGWVKTHDMFTGITTSQALEGDPGSSGGEQNILIMGLDSRLDEHGNP